MRSILWQRTSAVLIMCIQHMNSSCLYRKERKLIEGRSEALCSSWFVIKLSTAVSLASAVTFWISFSQCLHIELTHSLSCRFYSLWVKRKKSHCIIKNASCLPSQHSTRLCHVFPITRSHNLHPLPWKPYPVNQKLENPFRGHAMSLSTLNVITLPVMCRAKLVFPKSSKPNFVMLCLIASPQCYHTTRLPTVVFPWKKRWLRKNATSFQATQSFCVF